LLSRKNELSRQEKDVIFERVLAGIAPRRTMRRAAVLAVAAAALAIVLVPLAIRDRPDRNAEPFGSRGQALAPQLHLWCSGQPRVVCHSGEKLMFDLQDSSYRYFAAFARRDDGTVLWYFPESATGRSIDIRDRLVGGVLDRGVVLDATHAAGHYQVYGIYSAAPVSREDIKARFRPDAADIGPETFVATRELVVQ
jgi:hypothetical protein